MSYTADYTLTLDSKWRGTVRADDTPDTVIDTAEHNDFADCVGEVYDLVEPDAVVHLGDIRSE